MLNLNIISHILFLTHGFFELLNWKRGKNETKLNKIKFFDKKMHFSQENAVFLVVDRWEFYAYYRQNFQRCENLMSLSYRRRNITLIFAAVWE